MTSSFGGPFTSRSVEALPENATGDGRNDPMMLPPKCAVTVWMPLVSPRTMNWPVASVPGARSGSTMAPPAGATGVRSPAGTSRRAVRSVSVKSDETFIRSRSILKNSLSVLMRPSMMMTPGIAGRPGAGGAASKGMSLSGGVSCTFAPPPSPHGIVMVLADVESELPQPMVTGGPSAKVSSIRRTTGTGTCTVWPPTVSTTTKRDTL